MDENKNSTPESTPEENNINPAQPEANTAGPGEGKNKRSLRNTICLVILTLVATGVRSSVNVKANSVWFLRQCARTVKDSHE